MITLEHIQGFLVGLILPTLFFSWRIIRQNKIDQQTTEQIRHRAYWKGRREATERHFSEPV